MSIEFHSSEQRQVIQVPLNALCALAGQACKQLNTVPTTHAVPIHDFRLLRAEMGRGSLCQQTTSCCALLRAPLCL